MVILPSAYDNTNNSRELEHLICSFYPNISLKYKRILYAICCIRNIGNEEHPSYRATIFALLRLSSDRHNPQVESIHYDRYSKAL